MIPISPSADPQERAGERTCSRHLESIQGLLGEAALITILIIILMFIWIVISMNVISSVHCYRDHKKPLRIKSPAVICSVARRPSPQPGISLIFTFGDIIGGD